MTYFEKVMLIALVSVSFIIWLGDCHASDCTTDTFPSMPHLSKCKYNLLYIYRAVVIFLCVCGLNYRNSLISCMP